MIGRIVTTTTTTIVLCLCAVIVVRVFDVQASPFSELEHHAHVAYDNGNYTGALFYAKKALQLRPNDIHLLTNIGSLELTQILQASYSISIKHYR